MVETRIGLNEEFAMQDVLHFWRATSIMHSLMKLLVATRNKHKLCEIREILAELKLRIDELEL